MFTFSQVETTDGVNIRSIPITVTMWVYMPLINKQALKSSTLDVVSGSD